MGFRDDIRVEISPPGPEAAQESVSRRRRVRTAVVAGVLAIAVAGGYAYLRPLDGTGAPRTVPATLGPAVLDALNREALVALGLWLEPEVAEELPGVWSLPVVYAPVEHVFGADAGALPPGSYDFRAACSGQGTASLLWEAPTGVIQRGHLTVPCGDGSARGSTIVLTSAGEIHVAVHGDDDSAGRAAFAIQLTDPRTVAARAALGPAGQTALFEATGDTSVSATHSFGDVGAGRYRLTLVCVGAATIEVALAIVGERADQELTCQPDGARIELEAGTTWLTAEVTVEVAQTTGLPGQAAYAFRVDRIG